MTILVEEKDRRRIREAGDVVREVFSRVEVAIKEGVTTAELDLIAADVIKEKGGEPAFKGYRGYPAVICASVNEVVVHGIPSDNKELVEGDIISVDVGVKKSGYFADAARTFAVGTISGEAKRLMEVTRDSLLEGVEKAIAGNRVSDISNAIQTHVKKAGLAEVRAFVGHGIGKDLHESPEVPNWGEKGKGPLLKEGLVLAIEPMINSGTRDVKIMDDGWTAVTGDGKLSAHFEDTVIVGTKKAEIIT